MALPILQIIHINLNCTDLQRNKAFFETFGLSEGSHMHAPPQPGQGMGIPGEVQWDGYGLQDHRSWSGPMIDLLQWITPATCDKPADFSQRGFARLGFRHPDLASLEVALNDVGATALEARADCLFGQTPEGLWFEVESKSGAPELSHAVLNCASLEASCQWYESVFGLVPSEISARNDLPNAQPTPSLRLTQPNNPTGFALQLESPSNLHGDANAAANGAGLFRMAVLVEDIQACYRLLQTMPEVICPQPPVFLDMGPDVPIPGVWALFFPDLNGACVELIQMPL